MLLLHHATNLFNNSTDFEDRSMKFALCLGVYKGRERNVMDRMEKNRRELNNYSFVVQICERKGMEYDIFWELNGKEWK